MKARKKRDTPDKLLDTCTDIELAFKRGSGRRPLWVSISDVLNIGAPIHTDGDREGDDMEFLGRIRLKFKYGDTMEINFLSGSRYHRSLY